MATRKPDAAVEQTVAPSVSTDKPDDTVQVELNGHGGQLVGEHGHYVENKLVALFHDGVAEVSKEVAKLLKELGVAK